MRDRSVVIEAHSGFADVESGVPCSARTRFQIASVSKQFTAAAVLLLAEAGRVSLDDPVDRWFGGCPDTWRPITVHDLLTHGSGLGHWPDYPMVDLCRWMDQDELIAAFQSAPPRFSPGGGWYYSSPAYVLLAHVVQRASDEPYRDFLTRAVFEPLEMGETFAGSPGSRDAVARGHRGGSTVPSFELDSVAMGAGDIWSTTRDLLRWNDSLTEGRLLSEESRRLMFTRHLPVDTGPSAEAYGYGWFLGPVAGVQGCYHTGDNAGFKAFTGWLPRPEIRIIVLSNQDETGPTVVDDLLAAAEMPG